MISSEIAKEEYSNNSFNEDQERIEIAICSLGNGETITEVMTKELLLSALRLSAWVNHARNTFRSE